MIRGTLHGVGREEKEWASFMKEPNGSHIFRTVSISSSFLGVFHRCQLTLHEHHTLNTSRKEQRECTTLKFNQYGRKTTTFSQNFFKM